MKIKSIFLRKSYWTVDYLNHSPIRQHYRDINNILKNNIAGNIIRYQYLQEIINHAVANTDFYKKYNTRDINYLPVVNKHILLTNYDKIKVKYDQIPHQKGNLFFQSTSGSTGTPFKIPQDTRKRNRRIAELKYFGKQVGFNSHERLIHLRTWNRYQNKTHLQSIRENIIPFDISNMKSEKLSELCKTINKTKAVALRGYASSIDLLARHALHHNIQLPYLKLVIAGSETLLDTTRDLIRNNIGCDIISQYANEENGILAQERPISNGTSPFYMNHASYFFEVLKLDRDKPAEYGEVGRLVITDLFNYAFPMIRYDTGDTGIISGPDEYSNGFPTLSKLYGRKTDLIYNVSGDIIHPTAISRMLKHYTQLRQWQFIQVDQKRYIIKLSINGNFCINDEIKSKLNELLGNSADISIEHINEIPILSSGKRKPIINKWKQ